MNPQNPVNRGSGSGSWLDLDERYIWHPYTQMQLVPRSVGVERGEGVYLYLSDGRRILDGISSWWVTLHGHAHPKIANAIAEQAAKLEQVIFAGFTHEPASRLAEKLVDITPRGLDKVFFSDNGSTAVEAAIKMAIQYWKLMGENRTEILALDHAYHGDTFGAMSASARGYFTQPFEDFLFHVQRLPFPDPAEPDSEGRFLEALRSAGKRNTIAAFIYEPLLLGSGGMLIWRPSILEEALKIAKEFGMLCIADEVLTGFGRTGTMFASDQARIKPELMTLSKGITGGFLPIGITMASNDIFNAFLSNDRAKTFFHGHSYTGNPISSAAALASLDIFESEPVFERIKSIEVTHAKHAPVLTAKHNLNYRQIGTIAVFEPKDTTAISAQSRSNGASARWRWDCSFVRSAIRCICCRRMLLRRSDMEFAYRDDEPHSR